MESKTPKVLEAFVIALSKLAYIVYLSLYSQKMDFERPLSPLHTNDIADQDSYNLFPLLDVTDEPTDWLSFDDLPTETPLTTPE
jgi:hypothetical protein